MYYLYLDHYQTGIIVLLFNTKQTSYYINSLKRLILVIKVVNHLVTLAITMATVDIIYSFTTGYLFVI